VGAEGLADDRCSSSGTDGDWRIDVVDVPELDGEASRRAGSGLAVGADIWSVDVAGAGASSRGRRSSSCIISVSVAAITTVAAIESGTRQRADHDRRR